MKDQVMAARTLLAVLAFGLLTVAAHAESSVLGEARALWAHLDQIVAPDPEKGRQDIEVLVDRMVAAKMNLLLPWVRSEYLAALMDSEYPKGNHYARLASWDALGALIDAAHQRGIQTHFWYSFTYYKSPLAYEFRKHPEWAARRLDEIVPDAKTGKVHRPWMTDVCNMHSGARQLELDLVEFLLERYPTASGVHIEEPGFGYGGNCFCDLCNQTFRTIYGFDQTTKPDGPEATDLKCLATTDFMRRLCQMMLEHNPTLVLSTNGGYRLPVAVRPDTRSRLGPLVPSRLAGLLCTADLHVRPGDARRPVAGNDRRAPTRHQGVCRSQRESAFDAAENHRAKKAGRGR